MFPLFQDLNFHCIISWNKGCVISLTLLDGILKLVTLYSPMNCEFFEKVNLEDNKFKVFISESSWKEIFFMAYIRFSKKSLYITMGNMGKFEMNNIAFSTTFLPPSSNCSLGSNELTLLDWRTWPLTYRESTSTSLGP